MPGGQDGRIEGEPDEQARLSGVFTRMAAEANGPISLRAVRDELGDRGFAGLLIFFAALNMVPLPPPASTIFGLPLLIVAAQLAYGTERAWLPRFVLEKSISAEQFRKMMDWLVPKLVRLERVIRPRYWPFRGKQDDRVIGVIALLFGIVVTLPIPLGNWLPACSTALLGIALSERDGVLLGAGILVGIAAIGVIGAVVGTAGFLTHFLFGWF
ncbi:MAG: exopolysaccharide biosynthesis protein [Rhizobiales bacterium]|nr:exopolysaccharide biosynthesis protein [Hyphomicrobiales bacterium]